MFLVNTSKIGIMNAVLLDMFQYYLKTKFPELVQLSQNLIDIAVDISYKDMREPHNWWPEARKMKRKIIYHYGPTNSGKTMTSLQRLINAENGVYCAPLRLLAREVYDKIKAVGRTCSMVTGDDKIIEENATHMSCTIQSCDLEKQYEVAIIDEIQMIEDRANGSAWTSALLGLCAKEIHLCGDHRAKELVTKLCKLTGDTLEFKEYTRRNKLTVLEKPVYLKTELKPADCLITFSKEGVKKIRDFVNTTYGRGTCGMIYGKLPPEIKVAMAQDFNNGKTKVLVATDAIGMGLNLNIKRIIFCSLSKMAREKRNITSHEIRQIAGRAGRLEDNGGEVGFSDRSFEYHIKSALKNVNDGTISDEKRVHLSLSIEKVADNLPEIVVENDLADIPITPETQNIVTNETTVITTQKQSSKPINTRNRFDDMINKAALFPTYQQLYDFNRNFEILNGKPISYVELLEQICMIANVGKLYNIANIEMVRRIAEHIQDLGLSLFEMYTFCNVPIPYPVPNTSELQKGDDEASGVTKLFYFEVFINMIREYSKKGEADFIDLKPIFRKIKKQEEGVINSLEVVYFGKHSLLVCYSYIYLHNKFPKEFYDKEAAEQAKEKVIKLIKKCIDDKNIPKVGESQIEDQSKKPRTRRNSKST